MSYGRYSVRGSYGMPDYGYSSRPSYGYMPIDESYMRGRDAETGRYVSRDSGKRYFDGPSYGYGSYERGYSGHSINDRVIDCLERMMDSAATDYERETIRRYIEMVRNER